MSRNAENRNKYPHFELCFSENVCYIDWDRHLYKLKDSVKLFGGTLYRLCWINVLLKGISERERKRKRINTIKWSLFDSKKVIESCVWMCECVFVYSIWIYNGFILNRTVSFSGNQAQFPFIPQKWITIVAVTTRHS